MVNNSSIINKANKHLSLSLTLHKKTTTCEIQIQALGLSRQCGCWKLCLIYWHTNVCRNMNKANHIRKENGECVHKVECVQKWRMRPEIKSMSRNGECA